MFNKQGVPFFIIIIPFACILFSSFFTVSYYQKLQNKSFKKEISTIKQTITLSQKQIQSIIKNKKIQHSISEKEFIDFVMILTLCVLFFLSIFTLMMSSIIADIVKDYVKKVETKEESLVNLNKTLLSKVSLALKEAKEKDKALFQQSRLASLGSMINMIAHQWRQPLSELSGVLMELELSTRFDKVDKNHVLESINRSDRVINYMSNTIDDFRNFYKPDKVKEFFLVSSACENALNLINASLKNLNIKYELIIINDKKINTFLREYSQVILNIISNAKDVLVEKKIKNPKIEIIIDSSSKYSKVYIKDNALGIKKKYLDLIFDPYFSTKDSKHGTGLGLYISKLIIEKNMQGELSVKNDKEGAVFMIKVKNG
ncbi:MAG: HAMP domain-containing histidine kinase [Campylobacterales bacterium]|nr:HAMP domain-containing histidine kinase [Campylobacterales bacterium]